jgi:hypothetical protein
MSGGSGIKSDLRDHYTPLPAGAMLWHVYPSKYQPRTFNPNSRGRFALPTPAGRAMFYGGDTSACALWESVLRNLVVQTLQPQYLDPALVEGWSITKLKLNQEVPVLDLRAPHFRHLSADPARHTHWQRLCVVPERDYAHTHAAARELVAAAPRAAGLTWHSRQLAAQTTCVLYAPPLDPHEALTVIDVIPLNTTEGWGLIDDALRIVGVARLTAAAMIKAILEELPPEESD